MKAEAEIILAAQGITIEDVFISVLKFIVSEGTLPLSISSNNTYEDIIHARIQRNNGYKGHTLEEVSGEISAIIAEARRHEAWV